MTNQINLRGRCTLVSKEEIAKTCGPGWEVLIASLIDDLFILGWDGTLMQVKEKFGGLRFYIGPASDAIHERIRQAEKQSVHTCIECGAPGKKRDLSWILVLCDEHAKGRT